MSMRNRCLWSGLLGLVLASVLACTASDRTVSPSAQKTTASSLVSPAAKSLPSAATSGVSFAGRTISIVADQTAGGGTDITARLYARSLPRFLPGSPTMIVRNMAGGGGTMGGNYVYTAKPDGLTVLVSGGSGLLAGVVRMSAAHYDFQKMEPIVATTEGGIFYMKPGIAAKAEDLPKAKGFVFGSSTGGLGWTFVTCIDLLGLSPKKVVLAYEGAASALRAFVSGEVDVSAGSATTYLQTVLPHVEKGEARPLFQTGIFDVKGNLVGDPVLAADIPTGKDVYEKINGKTPTGMAWDAYIGLVAGGRGYGKVLLLPPGVPENIIATYRDAAEKMIKDAEFNKIATSLGGGSLWSAGGAFATSFKERMTMDPKVISWLKTRLQEYQVVIN